MNTQTQRTDNQCVVYYRVSRSKQSDQRQETDILEFCKKNGYRIATTAFREKISGTRRNRKAMTECIEYAKGNNIKYLICSELSRLGRSNEVNDIVEELTKEKICVISLKENISTMKYNEINEWVKDDDQIFLVGILTAINVKESNTIGYRIASGKRNSVYNKNGYNGGKYIPYGYESKYIDENNKGVLTINPKEAEIIKLIFKKYAVDGWGAIRIANWLNLENVRTRTVISKWSRGTINNILYNSLYIGQRKYKGDIIHNEDFRIIDDFTYNTVQKRRTDWKNANPEFKITRKYEYLFDMRIIKCGICGKHFYGIIDSKSKRNFYKCTSGKYTKGCGNSSIRKNWLELKVQDYIIHNAQQLLYDNTNIDTKVEKIEVDYKLLKAEQDKYINSKDRYNEMYAMGNMSKAKYIERIDIANERIQLLQEQLTNIQEKLDTIQGREIEIELIKGHYTLNKETNSYELKKLELDKQTLHRIIKSITVHKPIKKVQIIDIELTNSNTFQLIYDRNKRDYLLI